MACRRPPDDLFLYLDCDYQLSQNVITLIFLWFDPNHIKTFHEDLLIAREKMSTRTQRH